MKTNVNILQYATLLINKRIEYPSLLERVEIKTPWHIVEEIYKGKYRNVTTAIETSLMMDVLRITNAGLITLDGN